MTSSNGQFTVDLTLNNLPGAAYNVDITLTPLSVRAKTGYIIFITLPQTLKTRLVLAVQVYHQVSEILQYLISEVSEREQIN